MQGGHGVAGVGVVGQVGGGTVAGQVSLLTEVKTMSLQ